jgi:uncharacterized protein (DUF58 family)
MTPPTPPRITHTMKPSRRALQLALLGLPVALLPALVAPPLWLAWAAYVVAVTLLIGLDGVLSLPPRALAVDAAAPPRLFIGEAAALDVRFASAGARPLALTVLADLVGDLADQGPLAVALDAQGRGQCLIPLVPERRGRVAVAALWLRWAGPLGLMERVARRPLDLEVPVVPNVHAVRALALEFFSGRLAQAGMKSQRYVGDGTEFDSLEEYRRGLDHRAIDWKASARHGKLMARQYRAERNHAVILAFDTGYLMSQGLAGVPKLDHAINAGLLLGLVCLKTGDQVGLFAFDERPGLYAAPQGRTGSLPRLQRLTADLAYSKAETNFTHGLTDLMTRLRRRSLIVVFTDFVDTVTADLMVDNLARLARRHVVLFVSLRDPTPDALALAPPSGLEALQSAVVAAELVREREVVVKRLRRLGVQCLDTAPGDISARLINCYLEIHRRELV